MCVVSVVTSQIPNQWVNWPTAVGVDDAKTLKDILEKLDALDKKMGAPDCSDEYRIKTEFMKSLDARIKRLEKAAKRRPRPTPKAKGRK